MLLPLRDSCGWPQKVLATSLRRIINISRQTFESFDWGNAKLDAMPENQVGTYEEADNLDDRMMAYVGYNADSCSRSSTVEHRERLGMYQK